MEKRRVRSDPVDCTPPDFILPGSFRRLRYASRLLCLRLLLLAIILICQRRTHTSKIFTESESLIEHPWFGVNYCLEGPNVTITVILGI